MAARGADAYLVYVFDRLHSGYKGTHNASIIVGPKKNFCFFSCSFEKSTNFAAQNKARGH
jgi:hypothetical protein